MVLKAPLLIRSSSPHPLILDYLVINHASLALSLLPKHNSNQIMGLPISRLFTHLGDTQLATGGRTDGQLSCKLKVTSVLPA